MKKIKYICDGCLKEKERSPHNYYQNKERNKGKIYCASCSNKISAIKRHRNFNENPNLKDEWIKSIKQSSHKRISFTACEKCNRKISSNQISKHLLQCDGNPIPKKRRHNKLKLSAKTCWNQGLTKQTSDILKKSGQKISKVLKGRKTKPLNEEQKTKVSLGMKKAHKDGRAWNIGKSRWNNQPSYPESFFIKVIENEFIDKTYKREYPFHKFSLDFVWPHKKKCIEIDGSQHDSLKEQKSRDAQKDKFLHEENWQCLRIKWKDMYKDTKRWIRIAKDFIDLSTL